jgi:hypothetical protein
MYERALQGREEALGPTSARLSSGLLSLDPRARAARSINNGSWNTPGRYAAQLFKEQYKARTWSTRSETGFNTN